MTAPQRETPLLLSGLYTDRYELSMAWVYWREGRADVPAVFDSLRCTAPAVAVRTRIPPPPSLPPAG